MSGSSGEDQSRLWPWRMAVLVLAAGASAVAGYLGVVSLRLQETPWGCGANSGCADVLSSRWSNVAGIPVGFVAACVYAVLAALGCLSRGRLTGRLLTIVASAVMSGALYFVSLQLLVIQAVCPWCMLDHGLGILAALAGLVIARRLAPRIGSKPTVAFASDPLAEDDAPTPPPRAPRASPVGSLVVGVFITLAFVAAQHFTSKAPEVARIESGIADSGQVAGELVLALKNGPASLELGGIPTLGPDDAPRRLVLMFDYCCPHCREAHGILRRLHPLSNGQWQILFVPTPLDADCNPAVDETEPRFAEACELARLSLAVWKLNPGDWPAFDAWLFEPETPRTAAEARQHASALYGELELAEVIANPVVDSVIEGNVRAYVNSGSKVLPVILSPGTAGIAGQTDSEAELKAILHQEFGYPEGAR